MATSATLPVGVEAYAAYALRAWLSASTTVSARTRRFARHSAIGSLLLGMAGQVAYHLLAQAHTTRAPWSVTMAMACLPVLVLGMGAALTHLLHADTHDQAVRLPVPRPDQTKDLSEHGNSGRDQHSAKCLRRAGNTSTSLAQDTALPPGIRAQVSRAIAIWSRGSPVAASHALTRTDRPS